MGFLLLMVAFKMSGQMVGPLYADGADMAKGNEAADAAEVCRYTRNPETSNSPDYEIHTNAKKLGK
jgi:hypothetical protein